MVVKEKQMFLIILEDTYLKNMIINVVYVVEEKQMNLLI